MSLCPSERDNFYKIYISCIFLKCEKMLVMIGRRAVTWQIPCQVEGEDGDAYGSTSGVPGNAPSFVGHWCKPGTVCPSVVDFRPGNFILQI
jgi:hypothetical protein